MKRRYGRNGSRQNNMLTNRMFNFYKRVIIQEANGRKGICEQLRIVADAVYEMPEGSLREKILDRMVEAYVMGKKMHDRLVYYKKTYNDQTGHSGRNIKAYHTEEVKNKLIERRQRKWVPRI